MYQYGYGRANGRLYDLQIFPPIIGLLSIISLIFTQWIFFSTVLLYSILIGIMGIKFGLKEKSFKYFISIPIVYTVEHISYMIGFWRGVLE